MGEREPNANQLLVAPPAADHYLGKRNDFDVVPETADQAEPAVAAAALELLAVDAEAVAADTAAAAQVAGLDFVYRHLGSQSGTVLDMLEQPAVGAAADVAAVTELTGAGLVEAV